jgi:hypothetical protein
LACLFPETEKSNSQSAPFTRIKVNVQVPEPYAGKPARTVLQGVKESNLFDLPTCGGMHETSFFTIFDN